MIIIDLQQIMVANLSAQLAFKKDDEPLSENLLRHMILNSIRAIRVKFTASEYGELIIACDGPNGWRKEVFPYYKASRKEKRSKSSVNWEFVFEVLNSVKDELKQYFPYRVIHVEGAEADDIIGVLCHQFEYKEEKILIISGDHDFKQLHYYRNVSQYDHVHKKEITVDDPQAYLFEHIIRGDDGDGIPNIRSDDDTFVTDKKQKPITQKMMDGYKSDPPYSDRNYNRNRQLIDLLYTPDSIRNEVLKQYHLEEGKNRLKLPTYFIKYKMSKLHEKIGEF